MVGHATSTLPATSKANPSGLPDGKVQNNSGSPSRPFSRSGNEIIWCECVEATSRVSPSGPKPMPLGCHGTDTRSCDAPVSTSIRQIRPSWRWGRLGSVT